MHVCPREGRQAMNLSPLTAVVLAVSMPSICSSGGEEMAGLTVADCASSGTSFQLACCPFGCTYLMRLRRRDCLSWTLFFLYCLVPLLLSRARARQCCCNPGCSGNCTLLTNLAELPNRPLEVLVMGEMVGVTGRTGELLPLTLGFSQPNC